MGERYWPVYFGKLASLLGRGGKAVIQTITIADDRFEKYRRSSDAIRDYIFPGGMLLSPRASRRVLPARGLRITDQLRLLGRTHAETLERWLQTFDAKESGGQGDGFR